MTRRYTTEIMPLIGPEQDIPAPDIGTDEQTMAWMMDTYSVASGHTVLGVVTGKPISLGGSLGRASATSRGVVYVALAALRHRRHRADGRDRCRPGLRQGGTGRRPVPRRGRRRRGRGQRPVRRRLRRPTGSTSAALEAHVDDTGSVVGFAGADGHRQRQLLCLDVDLLVPAAVEGVLHAGNAGRCGPGSSSRAPTAPPRPRPTGQLAANGVLVVPDILANAGGVIVSYFEWVQANQAYWWSEAEVEARLADRMTSAWQQVVADADRCDLPLRTAATCLAVRRVAEAHQLRGLYP